jgi:hypothetical protein
MRFARTYGLVRAADGDTDHCAALDVVLLDLRRRTGIDEDAIPGSWIVHRRIMPLMPCPPTRMEPAPRMWMPSTSGDPATHPELCDRVDAKADTIELGRVDRQVVEVGLTTGSRHRARPMKSGG